MQNQPCLLEVHPEMAASNEVAISEFIPGEMGTIQGRSGFIPGVPKVKPHTFDRELFRNLLWFHQDPNDDYLLVVGPMGSGKTSTVVQYYARLNTPVFQFNTSNSSECNDLLGQWIMSKNGMTFLEGPLIQAAREGGVLLINEFDMMPPGEQVGLNDLFSDGFIRLPMKGNEVIAIHDDFRVVITANHMGVGGDKSSYAGVFPVNQSVLDRCRIVLADYMELMDEGDVLDAYLDELSGHFTSMAPKIEKLRLHVSNMVNFANETRLSYKAGLDGTALGTNTYTLSLPMSTRTLIRWVNLTIKASSSPKPLAYALDRAFAYRLDKEEREALVMIGNAVFGDDLFGEEPSC